MKEVGRTDLSSSRPAQHSTAYNLKLNLWFRMLMFDEAFLIKVIETSTNLIVGFQQLTLSSLTKPS